MIFTRNKDNTPLLPNICPFISTIVILIDFNNLINSDLSIILKEYKLIGFSCFSLIIPSLMPEL